MSDIRLSDVRIFYDQDGQAQEVLMSYDTFRHIQALLARLRQDPDQGYFWSEDWQARIQEGETDVQAGRTVRVTADTLKEALEWLDEYG